jgi:3-oxoadipate enol-lactonase
VIDRGQGSPVVLIPGIQGRWEWMAPAIEALSARTRVLSFSLDEGNTPGAGMDPGRPERRHRAEAETFEAWVRLIDHVLDSAGIARAAIAGVSFGGLIAVRYAAQRPERVASLVLVSAPSPRWPLDRRRRMYLRHPHLALPLFAARGAASLLPETFAARVTWRSRVTFGVFYAVRAVRFPVSPRRMAAWVRAWQATDLETDCRHIAAPTLVLTGEPGLDRQVPVASTRQYLGLIRGARYAQLRRTGHIGLVSRPDEFASVVTSFVDGDAVREASSDRDAPAPGAAGARRTG